jgi:thiol-disulfide isomerase/thioredoxin
LVNKQVRWLLILAVIAIAAIVIVPFFRSDSSHASGPSALVGTTAPVFTLSDAGGASVSLQQYRGRVVLMNLWASWCPPCRAEMPDLQRLSQQYASAGLVVVGVNEGESPQRAQAFAQSLGIRFPIWIDDQQRYGRLYAALGMPTTVIIGRDGNVVKGFDGALTLSQMQDAVKPFLNS